LAASFPDAIPPQFSQANDPGHAVSQCRSIARGKNASCPSGNNQITPAANPVTNYHWHPELQSFIDH
jgi:hypothetical protein